MTTFLAIYRGESVADAELLAVSSQPALLRMFAEEILRDVPASDAGEASEGSGTKGAESLHVVRGGDES